MSDIIDKIDDHGKEIKKIEERLNIISKKQDYFISSNAQSNKEIRSLSNSVLIIKNSIDEAEMNRKEKGSNLMYAWLLSSFLLIILSFVLSYATGAPLKYLELASSWITCAFLIFGGFYASLKAYERNKRTGVIIASAWALISTCYVGYILINFGSIYPEVAAIGFNISTLAQTIAIICAVFCSGKKDD